ncbi:acyl carrier protein [Streptomyces sp. NPDC008001]|uniref:acyl carrier protein n=1 Tax=Streptomyces sp. NPDC008001 TaxID=3364804 RepID=UPI0036E3CD79
MTDRPEEEHTLMTGSPEQTTAEALAEIWREVIGQPPTADTDFFKAGGDSMRAAILTTKVKRTLEKGVRMSAIFDHRTFGSYLEWVEALRAERGSGKPSGRDGD